MLTKKEARERCLLGWNLRCNLCGSYGALWINEARPGWGALALCPEHKQEWHDEQIRHSKEVSRLRTINFEQEDRRPQ